MELIHSDENRIELRQLTGFSVWDNVSGLDFSAQSNTFQLTVSESTWSAGNCNRRTICLTCIELNLIAIDCCAARR